MSALRTAFQVILTVCLLVLAAAAALLAARLLHWPLPTVGLAVAAVAALVVAVRFGPGLWRRLSAARDRAAPSPTDAAAAQRVAALRERWRLLTGQLKGSRLGRRAVEALPWYLLLGDEGSGKTSALRNCRRVAAPAPPPEGPAGSRLGWALLEGAVVLDAPGSYVRQAGEEDRAEWAELLALLARTRAGLPLDGAVVTVAADALLRKSPEELKADAGLVRQRLDEAIRRLGVRFPVCVLVTRWDRVEGMSRFFQCLPPACWEQAVGAGGSPGEGEEPSFAESVVARLADRLGGLRLTILADRQLREAQRQALLFPEETAALGRPLAACLGTLFASDPYRESASLRGIYFSSAHQEGKASPGLLSRLGFPEEELPAPAEDRSFFLSGFFGDAVLRAHGQAAPTTRALTLRSLTRNLGLTAWSAACLLTALLLTVSFARTLSVLREAARDTPSAADLTGRLEADLSTVDRLRASAEGLRAHAGGWGPGQVLLPHARRAEAGLWAEHDRRFRRAVLVPLDAAFEGRLERVLAGGSPEELAAAVDLLVKRTKLVERAAGAPAPPEELGRLPQPSYAWFLGAPAPGTVEAFQRNYLAHLARGPQGPGLSGELSTQRERLNRVLTREGATLDWLVDWASLQEDLRPVRREDFWNVAVPEGTGSQVVVEGAYTPEGSARIQEFLAQIGGAFPEGGDFGKARARFESSYRRAYLARWEAFLAAFPAGEAAWRGRERRAELALRLGGRESPYSRLAAALPEAMKPVGNAEDLPGWVPLAYHYQLLARPAYQEAIKRGQGTLGALASRGTETVLKAWNEIVGAGQQPTALAEDIRAYPFWVAYQDAVQKASERARMPQAAFQAAKETFAEAELAVGEPQQPVARALWSVAGLRRTMGKGAPGEELFWTLLEQQVRQIWSGILSQAEVELQRAWEADVLQATLGLTPRDRGFAVWGQGGKAWDYLKAAASPFLTRAVRPAPKPLHGASIQFSRGFLDGLAGGPLPPPLPPTPVRVQLSALPTDANPEATAKPHTTRLVLQCGSGSQELVNQNYPVSRSFNWSAQDCADTTLEIGVGSVTLRKWYPGPEGFGRFLAELRGGRRVFRASEFPDQRAALAAYRVETIAVSYVVKGSLPAAAPTRAVPDRVVP